MGMVPKAGGYKRVSAYVFWNDHIFWKIRIVLSRSHCLRNNSKKWYPPLLLENPYRLHRTHKWNQVGTIWHRVLWHNFHVIQACDSCLDKCIQHWRLFHAMAYVIKWFLSGLTRMYYFYCSCNCLSPSPSPSPLLPLSLSIDYFFSLFWSHFAVLSF